MISSSSGMLPAWLCVVIALIAAGVLASIVSYLAGLKRGREVERMETAPNGIWHFRDGYIRPVRALSPVQAIERLIESAGGY